MEILGEYDSLFAAKDQEQEQVELVQVQPGTNLTKEDVKIFQELVIPQSEELEDDMAPEQAIAIAELKYENNMTKSARVLEDDLSEWNLGSEEDPKIVKVSVHVQGRFKEDLLNLLKEFKDIFAWEYSDMKGIDPSFYSHKINLKEDAKPVIQQRYRRNPNYAKEVKEEIDKLLRVGFIKPVHEATWLSAIVVVPKKNGKIRVCVDYKKLNAATITHPYPVPFATDTMLDSIA